MSQSRPKIAFVHASWHADIVAQAHLGFAGKLAHLGVNADVDVFAVPGAFEIPLKIKQLLKSGDYTMAVAAGLVVDGDIYRHEFVAQAVITALMQVQLELEMHVLSVVLTPKVTFADDSHHAFFFDHMKGKGEEAAIAAAALLQA